MVTLLYSPFPTLNAARAASTALLEQGLVACCNLLSGVESHYVWSGTLTQDTEVVLIAKTLPEFEARARAVLQANHPYECPAILSFMASANPEFAAWTAGVLNGNQGG